MLTRIVRISKMSCLNIQNRSQCSFGSALEVHLTQRLPNVVLVLKYGESNAMESALNTCQMPQTAR